MTLFVDIAPILVILNAIIIMTMLLDIRPSGLSVGKRMCFFAGAAVIILLQPAALYILGVQIYASFYLLFAQLPTLLLFWAVARRGFIRTLFVMLTTTFLCSPAQTVSKLCYGILQLPDIFNMLIVIAVDILMLFIIWRYMKPSFDYILYVFTAGDVLGFCTIPLLYNLMIHATGGYIMSGDSVEFRLLICLSTLVSYFLLINLFRRTKDISDLKYEKEMLAVEISTAQQKMEDYSLSAKQAATYRHDLRHHAGLVRSFLEQGETDRAKSYLNEIQAAVESITPVRFCENEPVNLILSSFSGKAEKQGVCFSVKADVPVALRIPDTELCAVLSNGLENALNAAVKVEDATLRKVYVDCRVERNMLLIEIENAYSGGLEMQNEIPASPLDGHGFGCRSMVGIAKKRNGFCTFNADDSIFTLRVVLPLEKEPSIA